MSRYSEHKNDPMFVEKSSNKSKVKKKMCVKTQKPQSKPYEKNFGKPWYKFIKECVTLFIKNP